jgi:hypothetical protein
VPVRFERNLDRDLLGRHPRDAGFASVRKTNGRTEGDARQSIARDRNLDYDEAALRAIASRGSRDRRSREFRILGFMVAKPTMLVSKGRSFPAGISSNVLHFVDPSPMGEARICGGRRWHGSIGPDRVEIVAQPASAMRAHFVKKAAQKRIVRAPAHPVPLNVRKRQPLTGNGLRSGKHEDRLLKGAIDIFVAV